MSVSRIVVSLAATTMTLLACSGDGVTGVAPARTLLKARFDTPDKTDCSVAGSQVELGTFRDPDPVTILDNSTSDRGTYHVACRVADLGGDKFAVDGSVRTDDRLVFALKGTFPKATDAKGFKVDTVSLSNAQKDAAQAVFTDATGQCNVLYSTDKMGVTAGRVWAEVTCTTATKDPVAGGAANGTCVTISQFRFEDCGTK